MGVGIVAGSGESGNHDRGIVAEQLGLVGSGLVGDAAVFPQEQVVLESHVGGNLDGEEALVVAVVDD